MLINNVMLAQDYDPDMKLPRYMLAANKYDGIRARTEKEGLLSRTNELIPNLQLQDWARKLPIGIEMELMFWTMDCRPRPYEEIESIVMSRKESIKRNFCAVAFDYYHESFPFQERLGILTVKVNIANLHKNDNIKLAKWHHIVAFQQRIEAGMEAAIELEGFEGIILKDPSALYKQGRSTDGRFIKCKPWYTTEGIITGYELRNQNTNPQLTDKRGYAKRSTAKQGLLPLDEVGVLVVRTLSGDIVRLGTGYTEEMRRKFYFGRTSLVGQMVEFRYRSKTNKGNYRSPSYLRHINEKTK